MLPNVQLSVTAVAPVLWLVTAGLPCRAETWLSDCVRPCLDSNQLLKSWGYNKAEASHYLGLMEALLQAEQDTQQAAAKAAAANAAAAAAGAEDSSLSAAAPATARDSSSGGSSAQPSRSSTSTQQAAASSGAAGKAPPAAAKGKAGFAAGGAAVKAGVRVQALAGGKAKPAGSTLTAAAAVGRLGSSADGGAASFAAQLEVSRRFPLPNDLRFLPCTKRLNATAAVAAAAAGAV